MTLVHSNTWFTCAPGLASLRIPEGHREAVNWVFVQHGAKATMQSVSYKLGLRGFSVPA